jgi:hypothetical protein
VEGRRSAAERKRESVKRRKAAAAERRKAAKAKTRIARPRPPAHDYHVCGDGDCARYGCTAYRDGLAYGRGAGYAAGYADGAADAAAATGG